MKKLLTIGIGLFGAFLVISCKPNVPKSLTTPLAGSSNITLECEVDVQKETCREFNIMTCAKVASCSGTQYDECLQQLEKSAKCMNQDIRAVSTCIADFGSVKCNEDLPASCLILDNSL
jgi:hypothetical protein